MGPEWSKPEGREVGLQLDGGKVKVQDEQGTIATTSIMWVRLKTSSRTKDVNLCTKGA